jgi:hypothetical protein
VIFAGKLVPFKRPMDLVAAAARFRAEGRDLCLLVAGAGPLESELSEAARTAGVPIRLLGFCNQTAMPQAYAAGGDLGSRRQRGARLWSPGCAFRGGGVRARPGFRRLRGPRVSRGNVGALADAIADLLNCPPAPYEILPNLKRIPLSVQPGASFAQRSS